MHFSLHICECEAGKLLICIVSQVSAFQPIYSAKTRKKGGMVGKREREREREGEREEERERGRER